MFGGLYDSGYSGELIESIFKSVNFDELSSDNLPRNAKTFY